MKITRDAVTKDIKSSKSLDATRLSPDDIDALKIVKDLQRDLERRVRLKKTFTVIFIE